MYIFAEIFQKLSQNNSTALWRLLSHVLSAVTSCPPSQNDSLFFEKKIVMLCPPSRNVCLYFKIIVTLCPLPQNIHRFIKNIVTFLSAHYKCPQKVCFVYLRLCISACSKFLFLHNVYQEFWTVYVDLLNTAENFAFFF